MLDAASPVLYFQFLHVMKETAGLMKVIFMVLLPNKTSLCVELVFHIW